VSRTILYVHYGNPAQYPPLEHSSRILAKNGWQVTFLGVDAPDETSRLRFPDHANIAIHLLRGHSSGLRKRFRYLQFCLWALWRIIRSSPAYVYLSDMMACPIGCILASVSRLPIVYHEHDSPNSRDEQTDIQCARTTLAQSGVLLARRRVARSAAASVLPQYDRARIFARDTCSRSFPLVVPNYPRMEEVGPPRREADSKKFIVYYHGNLGPLYLPLSVLDAISQLPSSVCIMAIGYETVGNRGYAAELARHAELLGLAGRFQMLSPRPRHEVMRHCQSADVGLAFIPTSSEEINNRHKEGASCKVFDYLASGLAVLVSNVPAWEEAYVKPGFGRACDPADADSIAAQLRWFHEHRQATRNMGLRGQERVRQFWNYEKAFRPVLELLEHGPSCHQQHSFV
jgi:glycosyltransferase involved in cell wall biosynthesis